MPAVDRDRIAGALPRYTLGDQLGSGSFGLVLAGHHQDLDRPVAIKVLSVLGADGEGRDDRPGAAGVGVAGLGGAGGAGAALAVDFRAEARMLSRLDHQHIVRIYDYVAQNDLCLLIMELLGGGTLGQHRLHAEAILAVGVAVADALAHAHAQGVLHRDIKPDNILFTTSGQPKLTDFGIGKILEGVAGTTSRVIGTPKYMAPEQIAGGQVGPAADLYALGVVLYELVAGRPLFDPRLPVPELLRHQCEVEPPPLDGVPPVVAEVVLRALAKDPADRQRDARELCRGLSAAASGVFGPDWAARSGLVVRLTESSDDLIPRGGFTTVHRFTPVSGRVAPPADPAGGGARSARGQAEMSAAPIPGAAGPAYGTDPRAGRAAGTPGTVGSGGTGGTGSRNLFEGTPYGVRPPADRRRVLAVALAAVTAMAVVVAGGLALVLAGDGGRPTGDAAPGATTAPPSPRPAAPIAINSFAAWALAPSGGFYLVDNAGNRILRLTRDGQVSVVAGTGAAGSTGDGGPATEALLRGPRDIAVDAAGSIYIADGGNQRVRRVDRAGTITTVAGGGQDSGGHGIPATSASLSYSSAPIAADPGGEFYIAGAGSILRVDLTGRLTTVARIDPDGVPDESAANLPEVPVLARSVGDIEARDGRLYVADYTTSRVQVLEPDGTVRTVAGTGTEGYSGDGGPATQAELNLASDPGALAVGPTGDLYIADGLNHRVRRVDAGGIITTVAGTGDLGSDGENGPAVNARLWGPDQLAVDADGVLYIAEGEDSIRQVDRFGVITTIHGG